MQQGLVLDESVAAVCRPMDRDLRAESVDRLRTMARLAVFVDVVVVVLAPLGAVPFNSHNWPAL